MVHIHLAHWSGHSHFEEFKYLQSIQSQWLPLEAEFIILCIDCSQLDSWKIFSNGNVSHLRKQLGVESFSFWDSAAFCLRLGWKGLHSKRVRVKSTVWSCYSGDGGAVIKKPDLIPNQGARRPTACLLQEDWPHTPLIHTHMILYTRKHTILGITHSRSKTHQTKTAD